MKIWVRTALVSVHSTNLQTQPEQSRPNCISTRDERSKRYAAEMTAIELVALKFGASKSR